MSRFLLPLAGLLLAGAALSSAARADEFGYGPAPTGRFVTPYDVGPPVPVGPIARPWRRPVRAAVGMRLYPETDAGLPPGPILVERVVEPTLARGLLYNTPPSPEVFASGLVRARY